MFPVQASPPPASSLPDAGSLAATIGNTVGDELVHVALVLLPAVFALLVLFWAINFVLSRTVPGIGASGGIGGATGMHRATRAEYQRRRKAEDRFVRRVERNDWELHFDDRGRMFAIDPTTGRKRRAPYQVENPDWGE